MGRPDCRSRRASALPRALVAAVCSAALALSTVPALPATAAASTSDNVYVWDYSVGDGGSHAKHRNAEAGSDPFALSARPRSTAPEGVSFEWASDDPGVASVESDGASVRVAPLSQGCTYVRVFLVGEGGARVGTDEVQVTVWDRVDEDDRNDGEGTRAEVARGADAL